MSDYHFQHTRSSGKGLTYDVRITPSRYIISLDGSVLADCSRPIVSGNVSDLEAAQVFAIADIEQLRGMAED